MRVMMMAVVAVGSMAVTVVDHQLPEFQQRNDIAGFAGADQVVEKGRSSCWRTNRSTGQKFKIC